MKSKRITLMTILFQSLFLGMIGLIVIYTIRASADSLTNITDWRPERPLNENLSWFGAVHDNQNIYIWGGQNQTGNPVDLVSVAPIQNDGSLGDWQDEHSLPTPLLGHATALSNGNAYILGGWNGGDLFSSAVYYTPLDKLSWLQGEALPIGIYQNGAGVINGHLYLVGGFTSDFEAVSTVYRANLAVDGRPQNWRQALALPQKLYRHSVLVHNQTLYVVGGYDGSHRSNKIYYTRVQADGRLSQWQSADMPVAREYAQALIHDGELVVLGGRNDSGVLRRVDIASFDPNGKPVNWQRGADLPRALYRFGAVSAAKNGSDDIYVLGGRDNNDAYRAEVYRSFSAPTPTPTPTPTPEPPLSLVGQLGGSTTAVAMQQNHAFIGVGPRLLALDVASPANPSFSGQSDVLPDKVKEVVVDGEYAYLANGTGGFRIVRISNPANLIEMGAFEIQGATIALAVANSRAYVTDSIQNLYIFDVANPSKPTLLSTYPVADDAVDLANVVIQNNTAYVVDGIGLHIIDVSDAAAPGEIAFWQTQGYAHDVFIAGNLAFIADGNELLILNIADATHPVEVSHIRLDGELTEIVVRNGKAYVAAKTTGIHIVNVEEPDTPTLLETIDTPGVATKLSVDDNHIYVVDGAHGLNIMSVASLPPETVGKYGLPGDAHGIAIADNYAYIADGYGLRVIDVHDPSHPQLASFSSTSGQANDVAIKDNLVFLSDGRSGMRVFDVSRPSYPQEIGAVDTHGYAGGIAVTGDYAYIADGASGLRVIDVSNPSAPSEMGFVDTIGYTENVAIAGRYAYLADGHAGLIVVDVNNPAQPRIVEAVIPPGYVRGVALDGTTILTTNAYEQSVSVIDTHDPLSLEIIKTLSLPGYAFALTADNGFAYVANGAEGLRLVDIHNTHDPQALGFYLTTGQTRNVAVDGEYLYALDADAGLTILLHRPPTRLYLPVQFHTN